MVEHKIVYIGRVSHGIALFDGHVYNFRHDGDGTVGEQDRLYWLHVELTHYLDLRIGVDFVRVGVYHVVYFDDQVI